MRITISLQTIDAPHLNVEKDYVSEDFPPEMKIAELKGFIETETTVPSAVQRLFYKGQELYDGSRTLQQYQMEEDSILGMQIRSPQTPSPGASRPIQGQTRRPPHAGAGQGGQTLDPELYRLQAMGNPVVLDSIRRQRSDLADAVQDPVRFRQIWDEMTRQKEELEAERNRKIELLQADPLNAEAQREIEEMIRLEAVVENLETAMQYNPEGFGRVNMLYISVEVNHCKIKAFVDSGAQSTIMSPGCATRCGLLRLIDKRYDGVARGVGTAKILGRIHSAMIKIGTNFLACGFTVMEGKDVDLLLGLDMLKKHQACIDLKKNRLIIQDDEVEFLGEADIPKMEVDKEEPTYEGPPGSKIGAISGTITPSGAPGASRTPAATVQPSSASGQSAQGGVAQQNQSTSRQAGLSNPRVLQGTAPTTGRPEFPKEDIEQLISMGFGREEVIHALEMAEGNVEVAAGLLL